jgi:hypothetical protein
MYEHMVHAFAACPYHMSYFKGKLSDVLAKVSGSVNERACKLAEVSGSTCKS